MHRSEETGARTNEEYKEKVRDRQRPNATCGYPSLDMSTAQTSGMRGDLSGSGVPNPPQNGTRYELRRNDPALAPSKRCMKMSQNNAMMRQAACISG